MPIFLCSRCHGFCYLKAPTTISGSDGSGKVECLAIGDLSEPFPVQQMLFTGIKPEMFNTHVVHSLRDEAEQLGVSIDAVKIKRMGADLLDVLTALGSAGAGRRLKACAEPTRVGILGTSLAHHAMEIKSSSQIR